MIQKDISIETALDIWAACSKGPDEEHLPIERLITFARPGGLKKAEEYEIEHLSLCPQCLEEFTLLLPLEDETDIEQPGIDDGCEVGFGLLKAAKTRLTQPLELTSGCRRFMLGIYPDEESSDKALFVFKTLEGEYDGAQVRIKDANGKQIMNSVVYGGRAAQTTQKLSDLDFSSWTVVLDPSNQEGNSRA